MWKCSSTHSCGSSVDNAAITTVLNEVLDLISQWTVIEWECRHSQSLFCRSSKAILSPLCLLSWCLCFFCDLWWLQTPFFNVQNAEAMGFSSFLRLGLCAPTVVIIFLILYRSLQLSVVCTGSLDQKNVSFVLGLRLEALAIYLLTNTCVLSVGLHQHTVQACICRLGK